jgi:hypothetical protein
VVVEVVFRVVVKLPDGATLVPFEYVWVLSVTTPLLSVVWVRLEPAEPMTGAGTGIAV